MFITDNTIVGYRVALQLDTFSVQTDIYCLQHVQEVAYHWRNPLPADIARNAHIVCCVCQKLLTEKYLLDKLEAYEQAIKDAQQLLSNNPLGDVYDQSQYSRWKADEAKWLAQIAKLEMILRENIH